MTVSFHQRIHRGQNEPHCLRFFFFFNLCYSFSDVHRRKREARVAAVRELEFLDLNSVGRVDADRLVEKMFLQSPSNRRARFFLGAIARRDIFELANTETHTDVYDVTRVIEAASSILSINVTGRDGT